MRSDMVVFVYKHLSCLRSGTMGIARMPHKLLLLLHQMSHTTDRRHGILFKGADGSSVGALGPMKRTASIHSHGTPKAVLHSRLGIFLAVAGTSNIALTCLIGLQWNVLSRCRFSSGNAHKTLLVDDRSVGRIQANMALVAR